MKRAIIILIIFLVITLIGLLINKGAFIIGFVVGVCAEKISSQNADKEVD